MDDIILVPSMVDGGSLNLVVTVIIVIAIVVVCGMIIVPLLKK